MYIYAWPIAYRLAAKFLCLACAAGVAVPVPTVGAAVCLALSLVGASLDVHLLDLTMFRRSYLLHLATSLLYTACALSRPDGALGAVTSALAGGLAIEAMSKV